MKRFYGIALALLAVAGAAQAGDINAGYTFTAGEKNITHTKLNSVVSGAVIQSSFISGKPAKTTVDVGDTFLLYDPVAAALRKVEARYLFSENPDLITSQTSFGTEVPLGGDYLLAYDTSLAGNRKLFLSWFGAHWTNWIANPSAATAEPPAGDYNGPMWAYVWNSAANGWYKVSLTNLVLKFWEQTITNTTELAAADLLDVVPIWDTSANQTKKLTVQELFYGGTNSATMNDTNLVPILSEGGHKTATIATVKAHILADVPNEVTRETSSQIALGTGEQAYIWTHSLGTAPHYLRAVLVCITADRDFEVGDEVGVTDFMRSGENTHCYTVSGSSTNVVVHQRTSPRVLEETPGPDDGLIDLPSWKLKIYAALFP